MSDLTNILTFNRGNICELTQVENDPETRKKIIQKFGYTIKCVNELKKIVCPYMFMNPKREQQILYSNPNFYIAKDTLNTCYYICYKNVLMLDIDCSKALQYNNKNTNYYDKVLKPNIQKMCVKNRDLLFEVYQSMNGFHLFLINKPYIIASDEATQIMLDLHTDIYYIVYSHIRGCSVRLNLKAKDTYPIYKFKEKIGYGNVKHEIKALVDLHIDLLPYFGMKMRCTKA